MIFYGFICICKDNWLTMHYDSSHFYFVQVLYITCFNSHNMTDTNEIITG